MKQTTQIFRPEALKPRQKEVGEVPRFPSANLRLLSSALVVVILALLTMISLGDYPKKTTLSGTLRTSKGLINQFSPIKGYVDKMYVKEGDLVSEGQNLAQVSVASTMISGEDFSSSLRLSAMNQLKTVREEISLLRNEADYRREVIQKDIESIEEDMVTTKSLLDVLVEKHERQREQVKLNRLLFKDRLVTKIKLNEAIDKSLDSRALLLEKRITLSKIKTDYRKKVAEKKIIPSEAEQSINSLREKESQIVEKIEKIDLGTHRLIKARSAGRVVFIKALEKDGIDTGEPFISILPEDSVYEIEAFVASKEMANLEKGQPAIIKFDAYPSLVFGNLKGKIKSISHSAYGKKSGFKVLLALSDSSLKYKKTSIQLRPGLTAQSEVTVSERNIMQWVLEPLYGN